MSQGPSSRCAWAESRTSTVENPPRTPAPAPASPPSEPPGPLPSVSPAAASSHQPSVCTAASPPAHGTCPLAARNPVPPRTARLRTARHRGSIGHRPPRRRGCSSLASTPPGARHLSRCGHTGRENVFPGHAWLRPIADVAVVALSRAAQGRRAVQTGLSCSALLLTHVLRPIPRRSWPRTSVLP